MTERAIANSIEDAVRDQELSDDSVMELLVNLYKLCAHIHDNGPDQQTSMRVVLECRRPDVARALVDALPALGMRGALSGHVGNSEEKLPIGEERIVEIAISDVMFTKQAGMHFCSYARQHTPSFFAAQPPIGETWKKSSNKVLKRNFDEVYKK